LYWQRFGEASQEMDGAGRQVLFGANIHDFTMVLSNSLQAKQ